MPRETRTDKDFTIKKEQERKPPSVIIYAGTSPRRLAFLHDAFYPLGTRIVSTPGGREEYIDDVIAIAEGKINFALVNGEGVRELLLAKNPKQNQSPNIIIASDVLTRPLMMYSLDRIPTAIIRRKPRGTEEIRKTFSRIHRAAGYADPFYSVESGTCIRKKTQPDAKKLDHTTVLLDTQRIDHFRTVRGFEEYEEAFYRFYSSEQYSYDGRHPMPRIIDIAGGLSLSVLLLENAVLGIDGVERENPQFRQTAKRALFKVLIGFSPDLLREYKSDIDEFIDSWPWLERTTAIALGEIPLTPLPQVKEPILKGPGRTRRST